MNRVEFWWWLWCGLGCHACRWIEEFLISTSKANKVLAWETQHTQVLLLPYSSQQVASRSASESNSISHILGLCLPFGITLRTASENLRETVWVCFEKTDWQAALTGHTSACLYIRVCSSVYPLILAVRQVPHPVYRGHYNACSTVILFTQRLGGRVCAPWPCSSLHHAEIHKTFIVQPQRPRTFETTTPPVN